MDSVFCLETLAGLWPNKKERKHDIAEPRRQILGFKATEVAGICGAWHKKEGNYTKKEIHNLQRAVLWCLAEHYVAIFKARLQGQGR